VKIFKHNPVNLQVELKEVQQNNKRFYQTPEGIFPSVTTVVGFEKQQFFAEWRKKNPEESKRVTGRGTEFHSLIEKYLTHTPSNLLKIGMLLIHMYKELYQQMVGQSLYHNLRVQIQMLGKRWKLMLVSQRYLN